MSFCGPAQLNEASEGGLGLDFRPSEGEALAPNRARAKIQSQTVRAKLSSVAGLRTQKRHARIQASQVGITSSECLERYFVDTISMS